jgi:predicted 3-demethylubiquinone-9 3-methyltransferase (glyoxalase superfamily)
MSKIAPCLWFNGEAEQAASFYITLFPDAAIGAVSRYGEGAPFPAGTALMVEFTLAGGRFQALNGGAQFPHTEAISLSVDCADQAEVDRYWEALIADGGAPNQCGWLKDRFGVSWQIVPRALGEILSRGDKEGSARAMAAMMGMIKLDIAALEAAYAGKGL